MDFSRVWQVDKLFQNDRPNGVDHDNRLGVDCGNCFYEIISVVPGIQVVSVSVVPLYCKISFPRVGVNKYNGGRGRLSSRSSLGCIVRGRCNNRSTINLGLSTDGGERINQIRKVGSSGSPSLRIVLSNYFC